MRGDRETRAALFDFVEQWVEDRGRGVLRPLAEYLERFPDHQEEVASEFLRLSAEESDVKVGTVAPAEGSLHSEATYTDQGELARGGMGLVKRVRDESLQRELAMKVALRSGTAALARFQKEARLTGQLEHPGIVPVHALGTDADGRAFFTMRLISGRDLSEIIQLVQRDEEGWTQARALGVLLRVCETVAYAHARGVVHRDIKPSNVRVGSYGEVYVMDWGLARASGEPELNDLRLRVAQRGSIDGETGGSGATDLCETPRESPLVTMDGDVIGTPCTMAPEQAAGRIEELGPRSDVYSVGAMLYELLSGAMPYVARRERVPPAVVLARVLAGPPISLHTACPAAPPALVAICEKAMARDPAQRYADMQQMADDLRAFLEKRVVAAYESGLRAELQKWIARNRALAGAVAAGVVVLIAGSLAIAILGAQSNRNWALAERRADDAERGRTDILRLSALQDLDDLVAEADDPVKMWPAHPDKIPAYRDWLARARALVAELPAYRAKRKELRAAASPRTENELRRDRESHPRFDELERLEGKIQAMRRSLARRRGGMDVELPDLSGEKISDDPRTLYWLAGSLVEPTRAVFGKEALGLALALRARQLAGDSPPLRAALDETVATAYVALGRDDDALTAIAEAREWMPEVLEAQYEPIFEKLQKAATTASSEEALRSSEQEIARLEAEFAELEHELIEYREWSFPEEQPAARWWNNQLTKLIEGLEGLSNASAGLLAADSVSLEHGWSVPARLALAERMQKGFAAEGEYASRWRDALPKIRAAYPELSISIQMGLVPIGPDPDSQHWEFWVVQSGAEPVRGEDGRLALTEDMGVVLVLLRGGAFRIGSQSADATLPNYYPAVPFDQDMVRTVELSHFFLSKYELTQTQWMNLTGVNPSRCHPESEAPGATLRNPVDTVSWIECRRVLGWLGLTLPSDAQWEYACRAGTDTPFSWPADADPGDYANLSDQTSALEFIYTGGAEPWDDGYAGSAPVGSFLPNAFGMHDMHGNLGEWCLDGGSFSLDLGSDFQLTSLPRDPRLAPTAAPTRVTRGGGFLDRAANARSSLVLSGMQSGSNEGGGVRPGRVVTP